MPLPIPRIILLSTLAVPTAGIFLATYLHNRPLSAQKSRTIEETHTLTSSTASSPSLKIINPRAYQALQDSRSIFLSESETRNLSDGEILARFTKGFFGGLIFTPERHFFRIWTAIGKGAFLPVGFSSIRSPESDITSLADLSTSSLSPKNTSLFGGNFLILDHQINQPTSSTVEPSKKIGSFVEVAYGDDRKTFAGMHRFEVFRQDGKSDGRNGVTLSYSSYACNPKIDKPVFPSVDSGLVSKFHNFYALCLFRDGVREVLRTG